MRCTIKDNSGFAMLTVLVVAAVMSVMAVVIISTSLNGLKASQNTLAMQRALNASEGGVNLEMKLGMPCGTSGSSFDVSWTPIPTLGADYAYRTAVQRIDLPLAWMPPGQAIGRQCILPTEVPGGDSIPDRLYLLQVEGRWRDARRAIRYVVQADSLHQSFKIISRGER